MAVLLLLASTAALAGTPDRGLSIHLAPQVIDGTVDAIEVTETFDVAPLPAGAVLLSLPLVVESVPGVLRAPETLRARDAAGPLQLVQMDDPEDPTQTQQNRHWSTGRPTAGTITVNYLARPRAISARTKPAALKDMRSEGAGVHGSTKVLLAMPETGWPRRVRIEWDLSAMAPGSRAVTSFGEGSVEATLDAEALSLGYFMAGPWQRLALDGEDGFLLYYLTPPAFDLASAARDAAATYRYATRLFGTEPAPMRAIMRTTDRFQGGGTGGRNSFMFGTVKGQPPTPDKLNYLLTHEALHNWIGSLPKGPDGVWFVEGATDYLTMILPYRIGQRSVAQVAAQIDQWTTNYYANPKRTMREDDAAAAFWNDMDAQMLTYSRGPLYLALVDARLRKASGGKRRIDELVRAMADGIRRGDASEDLWLSLVVAALGEQGKRDFEDMKAGRMLDLPDDLFGPCFRRTAGPVGLYRPGFNVEVGAGGRHLAGAVRAGSPAGQAGLVAGDEILNPQALNQPSAQPGSTVTLRLRNPAGERTLQFDPWVSVQDGFAWVEASPRPEACGL